MSPPSNATPADAVVVSVGNAFEKRYAAPLPPATPADWLPSTPVALLLSSGDPIATPPPDTAEERIRGRVGGLEIRLLAPDICGAGERVRGAGVVRGIARLVTIDAGGA